MELPEIGQHFADYSLEEVLGRGDLAVVYRARSAGDGAPVAIKLFLESAPDESELSQSLSSDRRSIVLEHPNLVRVLDTGSEDGRPYLVMELVAGPSLRALLDERGRLDPALAAAVIAQIGDALDAIHAVGLVHRNVAPANILLDADLDHPRAYLSDFSLLRGAAEDGSTNVGILRGSTAYFAPERVIGLAEIDARADVYSLGCVLFEALTGQVPFGGGSAADSFFRRTSEPPPVIREVNPELGPAWARVIERALATEPDERYQSAGELGRGALAAAAGP